MHELKVYVSVNGQNYFSTHKSILYNAPDFGLTFEQIVKQEELDIKNKKVHQKNVNVKK